MDEYTTNTNSYSNQDYSNSEYSSTQSIGPYNLSSGSSRSLDSTLYSSAFNSNTRTNKYSLPAEVYSIGAEQRGENSYLVELIDMKMESLSSRDYNADYDTKELLSKPFDFEAIDPFCVHRTPKSKCLICNPGLYREEKINNTYKRNIPKSTNKN